MLANLFASLDLLQQPLWIITGVGAAVSALALFLGDRWVRQPLAPPALQHTGKIGSRLFDEDDNYDPFVEGSRTEKRRAIRRKGNEIEVESCHSDDESDLWYGWVIDRS